jgi:hypothetical protein
MKSKRKAKTQAIVLAGCAVPGTRLAMVLLDAGQGLLCRWSDRSKLRCLELVCRQVNTVAGLIIKNLAFGQ